MTQTTINNDEDWLDLNVGDTATVIARLSIITDNGLIVTFRDWADLYIAAPQGTPASLPALINEQIAATVVRTEDGLQLSSPHSAALSHMAA